MFARIEALERRRLLSSTLTSIFTGHVTNMRAIGSKLFFDAVDDNADLTRTYANDGTTTGNTLLLSTQGDNWLPRSFGEFNGQLLFEDSSSRGSYAGFTHPPLNLSDGTVEGTRPAGARWFYVSDFHPDQTAKLGSYYYGLTSDINDLHVQHFVRFRDSLEPTVLASFRDFNPQANVDVLGSVVRVGGRLFFRTGNNTHQRGPVSTVWTSDGTKAGTHTLRDFPTAAYGADDNWFHWPYYTHPENGVSAPDAKFYFVANDSATGTELWTSYGVNATRVTDIIPGSEDSTIYGVAALGKKFLFYAGTRYSDNMAIYATDGTPKGTTKLANLVSPLYYQRDPVIGDSLVHNGKLFFPGATARELWVTDGTVAGTKSIFTVYNPHNFTEFHGQVYFVAADPNDVEHLYQTDGTTAGTRMAVSIPSDRSSAFNMARFSVIGDSLYFTDEGFYSKTSNLYRLSDTRTAVSGVDFEDPNANGARNRGESVRAGKTVFLDIDGDGSLDSNERSTTTDLLGRYSFADVPAGTFTVREVSESERWQTTDDAPTELHVGDRANIDVGSTTGGFLAGYVYNDESTGGVYLGETNAGAPGMRVFLDLNNDGKRDANEPLAITNDAGRYSFSGLERKQYVVRMLSSPIWENVSTKRRLATASPALVHVADVVVGAPPIILGAIDDRDAGAGVRLLQPVKLFLDANNNGLFDAGEVTATSDTQGHFKFSGPSVTPGFRTVLVVPGQGRHVDPRFNALDEQSQNQIAVELNIVLFGIILPTTRTNQVGGRVFSDANHDNIFDDNDELLGVDVPVYIDANDNSRFDPGEVKATKSSEGGYVFSGVKENQPLILRLITDRSVYAPTSRKYSVSIAKGEILDHLDFALEPLA